MLKRFSVLIVTILVFASLTFAQDKPKKEMKTEKAKKECCTKSKCADKKEMKAAKCCEGKEVKCEKCKAMAAKKEAKKECCTKGKKACSEKKMKKKEMKKS